jgi:GT2 family glycosyltransferase/glycosyltransferase involved in cell wall biosynthesis
MPERGLSVVIVAYGVPGLLAECLAATDGKHPVIVVDNSSSPEVRSVVSDAGATYRDPGRNLGFAAGVNRALDDVDLAETDVLLLNPDSKIDPASIERLHTRLLEDARLACVAPKQRQNGSMVEDRVAWPFPTPLGAWIEASGFGALRRHRDFAIGAVLMLRGEALVEVGGFDERFFLYAEETDWQRRASRLGWRSAVCEGIWATHVGAASDADTRRRELRSYTGAERYVRKHHGRMGWTSYRLANVAGATVRAVILTGARRRSAGRRAWIYARGPDRVARRCGAVPPPVLRVPELAGHRRATSDAPSGRNGAAPTASLRVLLDARDVGINRKGVGRVLEEVVPRLIRLDPDRYVVIATRAARSRFVDIGAGQLRIVRCFPQTVWEQIVLPFVGAVLDVDATYSHRECAAIWGPPVLLHVTEDPEVRWKREANPVRRARARRRYSRWFMNRSLRRARVVTSTDSTRNDLVSRHGLRAEQISVVGLGVDLERFTRSAATRSPSSSYFFCLASADPRDHCELVLESFAKFRSGSSGAVRLMLAGDLGDDTSRIKALSRHLKVTAFVDLPGRLSDEALAASYAGSLAAICATSDEGFGLQPLEALASGALLIAARAPAVEEVTRGGVVLWVDLEVGSVAEAMSIALGSPSLRKDAAEKNPAVAATFDWSVTATELHRLLDELGLAERSRRRHRRIGWV